jgi:TP901 family phage tail tape measure protein
MSKLLTIALMFKVLDSATAPVRRINDTIGRTGREMENSAGKGRQMGTVMNRISAAAMAASGKIDALNRKTEKFAHSAEKLDGLGRPLLAGGALGAIGLGLSSVPGDAIAAEHSLRSLGNVGDLTNSQLSRMNTGILGTSRQVNQTQKELIEGMNVLVAAGLNPEIATKFMPVIGKTATAATAAVGDISKTAFSAYDNLKVPIKGLNQVMDTLSLAGKEGRFELKDMATYFPTLTAGAAALGAKGVPAVAQLAAGLQIAMKGAADPSAAANNFQNFLQKITAKDTVKNFAKFGINVESELNKALKSGIDPFEHMVGLIQRATGGNKFKLSELFGDMQVTNFLNPMMKNMEEYRRIRDKSLKATGVVDKDFNNMMGTTVERWKQLKITIASFAMPALAGPLSLMNTLLKAVSSNALVAKAAIYGIGAALAGGAVITTVAGLAAAVPKALEGFSAMAKGASFATGKVSELYLALRRKWVLSRLPDAMFGDVIPGRAATNVSWLARLRTAFYAASAGVRAFSMTLLTTPVGWIALGIAAVALLIYKFWKPIKAFFTGVWEGLKAGLTPLKEVWNSLKSATGIFSPLVNQVKQLLTPVGATQKQLSAVAWWGKSLGYVLSVAFTAPIYAVTGLLKMIKMALTSFKQFYTAGWNIARSLGEGIKAGLNHPVEAIKSVVKRVRNFLPFSPAKEGPLRDIHRIKLVETIADSMKPAPMVNAMRAATAATMLAVTPAASLAHSAGGTGGSMTVHFSPQITVQGGSPEQIKGAVHQAMTISFVEFERLMQRYESQRSRREF